ncbi:acyl carrier protein [Streptosporangium sp. NPDC003464]
MGGDAVPDLRPPAAGRQVEEIWKSVLDISEDEADATFFELGGRAITALRIVARVENALGVRVEVGELYEHPSMDSFVHHVMARAQFPPVVGDR